MAEEEKVVESEAQTTQHNQSTFWSDMNTCGSCKTNLCGNDGKLLVCLHTFCRSCITAVTDSSTGKVKCPICHEDTAIKALLDNRLVSQDKAENAESSGSQPEEKQSCMACEEDTPASSYCLDCSEWLCEQCVQAHRRVRMTKDHIVELKENVVQNMNTGPQYKAMFCPVHKHELLKLFCDTCDQLTCRDCQLLEHKGHKYNFVHEAAQTYKNFLQQLLQKITEKKTYIENAKALINKRNKEIGERENKVADEIKKYMMAMIAEISKRGKKLVQELNSVCTAKKSQLGQKNQEILALSMKLDHCLKFTQFIINHGDNQALLHSKKFLVDQLRLTLRTRCEVPNPNHVVDIRFAFDQNFKSNVEKLGMVIVDKVPFRPPELNRKPDQRNNMNNPMYQNARNIQPRPGPGSQQSMSNRPGMMNQNYNSRPGDQFATRSRPTYPPPTSTQSTPGSNNVRTGSVYYPPQYPPNRNMHPGGAAGQMINLAQLQAQRAAMQRQNQNRIQQQMEPQQQQPSSTVFSPPGPTNATPAPIVIEPEPTTPPGQIERYPEQTTPPLQMTRQPNAMNDPHMGLYNHMKNGRITPGDENAQSRPSSSDSNVPSTTVKTDNYDNGQNSFISNNANSMENTGNRSNLPEFSISPETTTNYFPEMKNENQSAPNNRRPSGGSITPPLPELPFNVNESIIDQVMGTNQMQNPGKVMSQTSRGDDPSEDWCAVCHNGGDLLCCDNCPKVFHLQCHVPALSASPSGIWQCNLCVKDEELIIEKPEIKEELLPVGSKRKLPTGLTDKEIKVCERILLELYSHESSVPFHEPVPKSVPNYYKIITQPMEFGRIKSKLSRQHFNHYQSAEDFAADVNLVFSNCATYNVAESEVGQAGIMVKAFFESLMAKYIPNCNSRPVTPSSDTSDYAVQKPRNKRKRRPEDIQRIEDSLTDSPQVDLSPTPPESQSTESTTQDSQGDDPTFKL